MSIVSGTSSTSNVTDNLSITKKQEVKKNTNELGQAAFLELMITQMNNQNPLSPQDNSEFVAQLAQFSSVEGLERLNTSFNSFASNNALQASSLVGSKVVVDSDSGLLTAGPEGMVSGTVNLEHVAKDLKISVYDNSGSLVQQIPVGAVPKGQMAFRWDGQNIEVNGELLKWNAGADAAPEGQYYFEVTATQNGTLTTLDRSVSANVNSVTIGDNGELILNLAGVGSIDAKDVKQFN